MFLVDIHTNHNLPISQFSPVIMNLEISSNKIVKSLKFIDFPFFFLRRNLCFKNELCNNNIKRKLIQNLVDQYPPSKASVWHNVKCYMLDYVIIWEKA